MAEYIERESLIEVLRKSHSYHARTSRDYSLLGRDIRLVKEQPAADVVEVVHAAWTDKGFCTNCGHRAYIACVGFNCTGGTRVEHERTPYCAGCGAKMDRKDDT